MDDNFDDVMRGGGIDPRQLGAETENAGQMRSYMGRDAYEALVQNNLAQAEAQRSTAEAQADQYRAFTQYRMAWTYLILAVIVIVALWSLFGMALLWTIFAS